LTLTATDTLASCEQVLHSVPFSSGNNPSNGTQNKHPHRDTAPPWNGEVSKVIGRRMGAYYTDSRKRSGIRWRLKSESESEIFFHDADRDLYTRFDVNARKGFQGRRRATSNAAAS